MKKIFKRVSAAVMALAVAATAVVFDVPEKMIAAAATVGNLSTDGYQLDDNGKLTIASNDGMTAWISVRPANSTKVTSVVINDSVTSIGDKAFYNCQHLSSITIPNSVKTIGNEAFRSCRVSLTSISIPDGVTSIGDSAFQNCTNLTSITISNSVTSIGKSAFSSCSFLESITIPTAVTSIGESAFDGCGFLTAINVDTNNSYYSSDDGVLFNKDKKTLIRCPEGKESSYTIPNGVDSIGDNAFKSCKKLTSIEIPGSVKSIGNYAFNGCSILTAINIPNGVTSIGNHAFDGCEVLATVTIPESVTSIGEFAFINCTGLETVTILNGVTSIKTYAFDGCTGLKTVTIPESVTSIGGYAFSGCTGLETVTILESVTSTSIGTSAFSDCTGLKTVTIPKGVTSIGSQAFYNCSGLETVTIPNSVTSIGVQAFYGCTNLKTVTFENATPPATIGGSVFGDGSSLEKIFVPAGSADTYKAVTNLQTYQDKIVEGEADNPCGDNATWEYDETTKTLTISGTGAMTNWISTTSVPWAGKAANIQNVVIKEGITSIGNNAFKGCSSLTSVTIPDGVDSIGSWAFDGCTELTSITIPESVTSIKNYAFQNCSQLTSITIPWGSRLANIGLRAFYNCSCLTAIDIPNSVTSIDQEAFSGCTSLMSITIPNGVTSISSNTFNGCSNLSSITIPNSVTSIYTNAFYGCSSLTSITIPNDVTIIDDRAFSGCSRLSSITIPEKVATIGISAFSNCTGLSSITIPNSVNKIYATAFSGCTNLETVTFENATPPATIGADLFNGCTNLEKIFVPAGSADTYKAVVRLDPYKDKIFEVAAENSCGDNATWAYDDTTKTLTISGTGNMTDWSSSSDVPWADKKANIEKVVINSGITSIGQLTFGGCSSLTSVTIPNTVTSIGLLAFNNCSSLTSITIPNSVTSIGESAFQLCAGLESIKIPGSVTSIEDYAFSRCTNLETVTFEGTTPPTTIGSNVFNECSSDLTINVPEGTKDAYKNALTGLSDKVTDGTPDNKCGANATWALDETTKTLTISGTGDMSNWVASGNIAPWLKDTGNIGKIKNVVINEGITSVGNYAFCRCLLLTSVTIPSSVTFIGDCAFNSCSALTSITIPSSVTSIGSSAFFNCGNLTSITIPKDVRSIGTSAFDRCSKLSEIIYKDGLDVSRTSIPDTATKVEYTVNNSKLNVTKITLGTGKTSFTVTDEMNISFVAETYRTNVSQTGHSHIYSGDVCQICDCEKPDNSCGANATWALDETTKTLTISGTGAMSDWTAENPAPWNDKAASIEKVVIADGITAIGNNAFSGCTSLETVTFEGATPPTVGTDAFKGCEALESIVVPDGSLSNYNNVSGLSSLDASIVDTTGKGSCGTNATWKYDDTTKTLTISGTGDMSNWTAENPAPWNDKAASIEKVVIADGITAVGNNAFNGCTSLETVTFEGATPPTVGTDAFKDCNDLENIVVPENSVDAYKNATGLSGLSDKVTDDAGNTPGGGDTPGSDTPGSDNSGSDNSGGDNTSGDNTSGGNENINPENISKYVQIGENVPKTELTATAEELVNAVLAPEELSQLKDTDKIGIVLAVVENVPTEEDKQSVESFLESSENVLAQYLDVSLFKVVNNSKTQITSTNKPIRITFDVPEELRAANRTFAVLRVHDGETVLLPDLDNEENTVTIETDKFSTYVLTYQEKASSAPSDGSGTTGDNNPITGATAVIPFAAMIAAAGALAMAKNKKK